MTDHGGPRPGAGRRPEYREPLRRATVALPESYIEQLRRYGQGNLSAGIRRLVEEALTPAGHFWYILPDWAKDPKATRRATTDGPRQGGPASDATGTTTPS